MQGDELRGLSEEQLAAVNAKQAELFEARKARNAAPAGLASAEDIAQLKPEAKQPLHSASGSGGILSVAVAPAADGDAPLVATGARRCAAVVSAVGRAR